MRQSLPTFCCMRRSWPCAAFARCRWRDFGSATPEDTVELFLAAQRLGIMVMGWDLLCPRCRGAKARVSSTCTNCRKPRIALLQYRLRARFHPQCRADLPSRAVAAAAAGRRAVPARPRHDAARQIPGGSRPRIRRKSFAMALRPGPYRFRTVEVGGGADAEIGADGRSPRSPRAATILRCGRPATRTKSSSATTPTGRCSSCRGSQLGDATR